MTQPNQNGYAVRIRSEDGQWWLNAEDLIAYFRQVSEQGVQYALEQTDNEDDTIPFATFAVARSIGQLANVMDVSLIAAATECQEGHPHTMDLG